MSSGHSMQDPFLDMYLFEAEQLTGQLEQLVISSEKSATFAKATIQEIFRLMHTIKGSSAMMGFTTLARLAHTIEDNFGLLRAEVDSTLPAAARSSGQVDQCLLYFAHHHCPGPPSRPMFTLLCPSPPPQSTN